ncbi:hypothetical protein FHS61_000125 [Altererythrobacter atlanticus]|uniref:Uncharacterized protein n=1 Tax=Croceibacterium atlanticum TaxID=1267766 RepID=A0A0F7KU90_9SPHN|nr:hypothetical protein [Croceibacterium atlanticum]AKH42355.1 hypothetical protein WYH_01312 [Croceibacterium atlanticum]MBB5731132.1 hypothetical protein [Croceibacterium atlanticum]
MRSGNRAAAPWHLWVVGIGSLLWNAVGAVDYTLTRLRNMPYLESTGMGPEEMAYLDSFPAWADAAWAVGVWACVAGSVLLLLRSKYAFPAFVVSLLGIAALTLFRAASPAPEIFSNSGALLFSIVLWVLTCSFALYARLMTRKGILR